MDNAEENPLLIGMVGGAEVCVGGCVELSPSTIP